MSANENGHPAGQAVPEGLDVVGPRSERDLHRFEAYCRWSLHVMILAAAAGLLTASVGPWQDHGPASPVVTAFIWAASLGWAVTGMIVTDNLCREVLVPRPALAGFVLCAALVTFGFDTLFPTDPDWRKGATAFIAFGPLGLGGTAAIASLGLRLRVLVIGTLAALAAMGVLYMFGPAGLDLTQTAAQLAMAFWLAALCIPAALATRWMIDVVRRLWRSRQVAADLAVAEERLRFSRDLHDVFGRTLSTVTVKSELAAELARRGDERAVAEMEAVREIAQTALTDIRGLVRGYRHIDFAGELAGARALLRAAGLRPAVTGDAETVASRVSPAAAEALAWVVREGVTNVLRHGRGGDVRIDTGDTGDAVVVTIENAVRSGNRGEAGTGLVGLRERLESVGGRVTVEGGGDVFRLSASVPALEAAARPAPQIAPHDEEAHR